MNKQIQNKLNQYADAHKKRKRRLTVVGSLCAVVALGTSYLLINPAVTQKQETYCGLEAHAEHTDACYEDVKTLICTLDDEGHIHDESCYKLVTEPVCEKPIHEHTLQCFSDPDADRETAASWEQSVEKVELTGNWNEDVLAVARTQLGYSESTKNYKVQEDGTGMKGYTRYGDWSGDPYGDWSAAFCCFCMNYARVNRELIPFEFSCPGWVEKLGSAGYDLYHTADAYVPVPGDLVFFDMDAFDPEHPEARTADHVGFVAELIFAEMPDEDGEGTHEELVGFKTIEGDSGDSVWLNTYDRKDTRILGYGRLPARSDRAGAVVKAPEGTPFELTAYTEDGVGVKLTGFSGALPFPVEEITLTVTKVYGTNAAEQLSQAAEADGLATDNMYLLDVSLWHDGEPVEPTGNVTVTFLGVCSDGQSASVYHVDPGVGAPMNMDAVNENGNAVIDTGHFSIYGVVINPDSASAKRVSGTGNLSWDSTAGSISQFSVTASSADIDNAVFYVEYSDNGTNWTQGVGPSAKVKNKGAEITLDASALVGGSYPAGRQYRIYAYKDTNNTGYSSSFTLTDLFEQGKPGFSAWLTNDYVQNFGGAEPQTQGTLAVAFALYDSLPTSEIRSSLQDEDGVHKLSIDVSTDKELTAPIYRWEYLDKLTHNWTSLTSETGARIDGTRLAVLNGGTDVRCKVYDGSTLQTVSNIITVNNSIDALRNETSVTVTKKWSCSPSVRPASITVRLFRNGAEEDVIELTEQENWNHVFDGLPYYDADGTPYVYTVSEDAVEGFTTTYSDRIINADPAKGTHYLKSGDPEDGESYILVGGGFVIGTNGSSFSAASAGISDGSVTYDGVTYTGELTGSASVGTPWQATLNPDGTYTLRSGSYYLAMDKDGKLYLSQSLQSGAATTSLHIDENGCIYGVVNNGAKTKYVTVKTKDGRYESMAGTDNSSGATPFGFYKEVNVLGAYDSCGYKITNKYDFGTEEPGVSYSKYIDDLSDGGENADTDLTGAFYREYLDVEVTGDVPYDFLFVVDNTSSMVDGKLNGVRRDFVVSQILNGGDNGSATPTEAGLLTQILRANKNNKVAVVTFCGIGSGDMTYNEMLSEIPEVHTKLDWCSLEHPEDPNAIAPYAGVLYEDGGGTCYEAGLLAAEAMLQSSEVAYDGNSKIVVFLGDGEPNGVLLDRSGNVAAASQLGDKDNIIFNWSKAESLCVQGTKNAMDYFLDATEDLAGPLQDQVELYTISVGYDVTGENDILGYMAEKGKGEKYPVYDIADIQAAFSDIISRYLFNNFVITDSLSQYAEVYKDQFDFRVVRIDKGGKETVIWEGGWDNSGNIGNAVNGGSSYIQSVTFDETETSTSTGVLTVTFNPNYYMEPGVKYVVSYNLKATEYAAQELAENGYGENKGDAETDYPGNESSSSVSGFQANESAVVTYKKGADEEACVYQHPVIQTTPADGPSVTKPTKPSEIDPPGLDDSVTMEKQIDWLGNNPEETGMDELYRLYLNLDVDAWPIDLLLVLDISGSMQDDVDGNPTMIDPWDLIEDYDDDGNPILPSEWFDEGGELISPYCDWWFYDEDLEYWDTYTYDDVPVPDAGPARIQIIKDFLNGTASDHKDGFIYRFLNTGADNKLAVMTFNETSTIGENYIRKWDDSEITVDPGDPTGPTNYMAALEVADQIWAQDSGSDHQKIMIFLSDGVPTVGYRDGHLHSTGERSRIGYGDELNAYRSISDLFSEYLFYAWSDAMFNPRTAESRRTDYNTADARFSAGDSATDTFPVMVGIEDLVVQGIPGIDGYPYGELTNNGSNFLNWYETVWDNQFGTGLYTDEDKLDWLREHLSSYSYYDLFWLTEQCFADFVEENPAVVTHSIGFTSDLTGNLESGRDRAEVLKYMAGYVDSNAAGRFANCSSPDGLANEILSIAGLSSVRITDPLSEYVELAEDRALKIELWLGDGEEGEDVQTITLYDNGAFTTDGETYLKTDETGFDAAGTLHVVFRPEYNFYEHFRCEASFNVQLTEAAYEEWEAHGYTRTGDENTDRDLTKPTSSGQPGLYSNNTATAEWCFDGSHNEKYPDPVVQVSHKIDILLKKVNAGDTSTVLSGVEFDLYLDAESSAEGSVEIPGASGHYGVKVNDSALVTVPLVPLEIQDLDAGHYYLVETKALPGYTKLNAPVEFDISSDEGIETHNTNAFVSGSDSLTLVVKNVSWYKLPATGGVGTTLYTLGGLVLMLGASTCGLVLWRRREKRMAK